MKNKVRFLKAASVAAFLSIAGQAQASGVTGGIQVAHKSSDDPDSQVVTKVNDGMPAWYSVSGKARPSPAKEPALIKNEMPAWYSVSGTTAKAAKTGRAN